MEAHTIGEPKLYARVLTYLTLFLGEVNSSWLSLSLVQKKSYGIKGCVTMLVTSVKGSPGYMFLHMCLHVLFLTCLFLLLHFVINLIV